MWNGDAFFWHGRVELAMKLFMKHGCIRECQVIVRQGWNELQFLRQVLTLLARHLVWPKSVVSVLAALRIGTKWPVESKALLTQTLIQLPCRLFHHQAPWKLNFFLLVMFFALLHWFSAFATKSSKCQTSQGQLCFCCKAKET